jgi:aldehyde dehydrogenase (NAD+)
LGNKADIDLAVSAAKNAYESWAFSSKEERISLLEKLYENYKKRWADISEAITLEMGAPKDFASKLQAGTGASHIKSFIRYLKNFEFEKPLGEHAPNQRLIYEPKGVCALITPWNWPMNQVCLKVMPAIASGCTMVLKPSELAPLSSMILAEIIDEVKFPKGVFNLVNGDGAVTGDALTSHPDINMISFTGSTRAGALISQNAAKDFKRVSLELGGKGANIIFKDADPEAIERGALRCFRNSGQSCNAPTRMLVEKSMYDEAVERLKKYTESFEVGDPKKEGEHIGPVISETQYDKIQTLIQKGIDEGAKLVAGGTGKPDGLDKGYFVKPTVFADVNNDMEVARTEIFGPVLSVIPFETEEDAIKIANDTAYGLTNYIQTQDSEKVQRVARKLRSGMVDVNGAGIAVDAPFGGFKHSGIGREAGEHGLEEFLEVKAVGGWS